MSNTTGTTVIFDDVTGVTSEGTMISDATTWTGFTTDDVIDVTSVVNNATTTHVFDTYNYFIHEHWRQFPLVSDGWHYTMGVIITCVGFSGILGNAIVIWMFSSEKSLRTSSNMFIVNLAISDMTFCVVNGFPLFSLSAFSKRWIFGQAACEFYGLIGGIFGLMSINTMATIAIDRYLAIARPIHQAKKMTRKKAFLMIITVWIWSLVSSLPPLFGWGRYIPEGFQTSCTFDYLTRTANNRSYIFFMYIFGFAVPLGVILVSYGMIIRAVKKHENEMKRTAKKMNAEIRTNQEERRMEIKVAKIAMTILVLYLASWTPYATVALIGQFGDASFVTPFWSEIPVIFAKASAMHNPIVYALSHPKFRAAVQKRLPWLLFCCEPEAKTRDTTSVSRGHNASRRSAGSVIGACSMSSEISNINDSVYADMEMRLRNLEEKTEAKRRFKRVGSMERQLESTVDDVPASKLIQELTRAVIEVASREKQAIRPVYLPSNLFHGNPETGNDVEPRPEGNQDGVFVLDSSTLPQLAKYLSEYSKQSTKQGIVNKAMDMSPDSSNPATDAGARPKIPSESDVKL